MLKSQASSVNFQQAGGASREIKIASESLKELLNFNFFLQMDAFSSQGESL